MCPFCFANMLLVAIGATSTGGLTAFVIKLFSRGDKERRWILVKKQTEETK